MKDTFKIWNRIWQRSYSVVNTAPSGASGVPNFNARRGTNRENDFEMGGFKFLGVQVGISVANLRLRLELLVWYL
ncbi:hypothetical protein QE152_g3673 [Popillia japonica]|uniref:Uncharacterized protein n=1 Tax=Popillia japonica TaxID=7064 RepID=A0AAW1N5N8_POPJA